MDFKYVVPCGTIEEKDDKFYYTGGKTKFFDPIMKKNVSLPGYTTILFPFELKGGKMSFDVEFTNVCDLTGCGFIIGYSQVDGVCNFYQIGIHNDSSFYSLDYYNGKNWNFLIKDGFGKQLKKKEIYTLTLKRNGSELSFFINDVKMFTYSKFTNPIGNCGIYIENEHDSIISNIRTNIEKPTAFSIMKFEKDFDDLYHDVIIPVCKDFGYESIRADECYTSSTIIQDIIQGIADASLVIADITMDNPNVFYELGYAHALNKPTILLADTNKRDRLPFDISGYRTIFYENSIGGKKEIDALLRKYVENFQR